VTTFAFCIQLSQGTWGQRPTRTRVRAAVRESLANKSVSRRLRFSDPLSNETVLECKGQFRTRVLHAEIVRDALIETLLQRFQPEYDSMVEVEVLDG
jgi:hypothetical protein